MNTPAKIFRKSLLASSISSLLVASMAVSAQDMVEEVVVTGVYASQQNAVNTKREAVSVVDAISAEDIGKLPDVTISDSLQRITGVQVERTAGEGGPVQIRGLSNVATTLNGETFLSATTISTAAADFGDLPSQLFSGANVYKSPLASLNGNGISGTIELKTRRPFDMDAGWKFAGSIEGDYGSITEEVDPTVSGLMSWHNDNIGVLISAVTTEKNLATDFNGYFDTSENGGIGATNWNHMTWGGNAGTDVYHLVPQGFAAFHKAEERHRDGINASFQANLTDAVEVVADYFYSKQERWNRRAGFSHNNRWQTFNTYAYPTDAGFIGDTFEDSSGNTWRQLDTFEALPYRLQSFAQTNFNEEESENANLEFNFNNGGPLTGQVRITRATATSAMRHGYMEGDVMSIDQGTLVTGPGGLVQSKYCDSDDEIVGSLGGCFARFSPGGIEDSTFRIRYDASGKHPVFSGFDQVVNGGGGQRSVADYLADINSYHIGAISSENNTDDKGELNTFSTKWNYEFSDTPFITSVDFGIRISERSVEREEFSYFAKFADTGCEAQWKAVDQFANTPECDPNLPQGEYVTDAAGNQVFTPYTVVPPMRIDQFNDVIWMGSGDFGKVSGLPGVWVPNPKAFDNTLAFQTRVFGDQKKFVQPGQSFDVTLDEFSYFGQVNFATGDLSGNLGVRVIETDLYIKQNLVGDAIDRSGTNHDIGDIVTNRSYTDVLPSLNLAYDLNDDLKLRASYGKTMQPLDLLTWGGAKRVGRVFNEECGCMRISNGALAGNPDLDPTRADNFDFSAEWYLGRASALSAGYYYIDIESFITNGTVSVDEPDADGIRRGPYDFDAPVQGRGGKIEGIELSAKIAFGDITDGFLRNFGFDVNYTLSDSKQEATDHKGKRLPFTNNSKDTYNLVGWFENDVISARLAYNFRSPRLMAAGSDATGHQALYQDDYGQLDLNVTYNLNENLSLYVNGSNITEEFQQTYVGHKDQKAFQNIYEARWALGLRANF